MLTLATVPLQQVDDIAIKKIAIIVVLVAIAGGGLLFWESRQSRQNCKDEALIASTQVFPMSKYPAVSERAGRQAEFQGCIWNPAWNNIYWGRLSLWGKQREQLDVRYFLC